MRILVLAIIFPCFLLAVKVVVPHPAPSPSPWLTGPIVSPSAAVVPRGHVNYEPYLYVTAITGVYDRNWKFHKGRDVFWNYLFQPVIQVGMTSWLNFEISPAVSYNHISHAGKWVFGDLPVLLSIQLYAPDSEDFWPYVKLQIQETFPTGPYKNLSPLKRATDLGGQGSFITALGLVLGKEYHLGGARFMIPRLFVEYSIPAPTHVKGLNAYGGSLGTDARLFPGQSLLVDASVEIMLSQRWAFACDVIGSWNAKTRIASSADTGSSLFLGFPSAAQFSIAPALEYNWNENLGIIGGYWFVMTGRNTPQFNSGVIAVNYYM